nr:hypothetical protein [Tanacetum cinerariifolium]
MMTQSIKILAVFVTFILIFTSFEPNEACRLLDGGSEEPWMKTGNLLLTSLQRGTVPTPGNGCSNTGNGGSPCIGSKKVVGGTTSDVASPPPVAHALSSTKI